MGGFWTGRIISPPRSGDDGWRSWEILCPTPAAVELARDVDLLVHEATYGREREDLAREHFHSTTIQAAEIARAAGVRRLILTHISPRYTLAEGESLAEEARALFPEAEVAKDGKTVTVEWGE